jgi:hypothetical protein
MDSGLVCKKETLAGREVADIGQLQTFGTAPPLKTPDPELVHHEEYRPPKQKADFAQAG